MTVVPLHAGPETIFPILILPDGRPDFNAENWATFAGGGKATTDGTDTTDGGERSGGCAARSENGRTGYLSSIPKETRSPLVMTRFGVSGRTLQTDLSGAVWRTWALPRYILPSARKMRK